jgi:hypothetical protein
LPEIFGLARNDSFVESRHGMRRGRGTELSNRLTEGIYSGFSSQLFAS